MKKIIMWCKRHNLPYTVENNAYNTQCVRICTETSAEYSAILSAAYKLKNVHIDTHFYSGTIRIYPAEMWETICTKSENKQQLTEYFWTLIHQHYTPSEAQAAQKEYAEKCGLMEAYREIYNISSDKMEV